MTEAEPIDILLVEDNPGDARLTQEAFNESSINTTLHIVADGVNALEFLHQRGDYTAAPRPDLIMLDLNLPRKHGAAVLKEVNEEQDLHDIPVVILTSSNAEDDIQNAYDNGANAFLQKPVDPFEFIELIKQAGEFWLSSVQSLDCGE